MGPHRVLVPQPSLQRSAQKQLPHSEAYFREQGSHLRTLAEGYELWSQSPSNLGGFLARERCLAICYSVNHCQPQGRPRF